MKLYSKIVRIVAGTVAAASLLATSVAQAQFASPQGTWDFAINGSGQQGVASIQFFENNTFTGHEILTTVKRSGKSSSRPSISTGRMEGGSTNSTTAKTNLFGYVPISGHWYFDAKGKILGFYSVTVGSGDSADVRGVSFTGKVTPGKRFTLLASTPNGKLTFSGVPFRQLKDLSAFPYWYGTKTESKVNSIEIFTLTPMDPAHGNIYWMDMPTGPGYYYESGVCLASAKKRIGFAMIEIKEGETNGFLRATVGSFVNTSKKTSADTKGIKEPDSSVRFRASVPAIPR